ncbi:TetR/AcrR family transcriptional regulator [Pedobacter yulinensis]|uniref:TetR/AcrR family transcriptional regulator n=1 Tax=Pedobacter yulinensis TaxID=2126353 RepID=A0A2T3HPP8_9SPHI|nr:TetR/AcrR family transcriptional regulator [Pedobacter yulinensis]PST84383.1 TetR/AcrR family transcriptional regulator [Pedobacter yulinensis]
MVVTDKKREQIIDGAIRRFIHFGINKTTMNEIAEDLSVSKPSLYYYFPDKSSLVVGVVERIFSDYFEMMSGEFKKEGAITDALGRLVEVRNNFFQKYYMLHLSQGVADTQINLEAIKPKMEKMRIKERVLYEQVLEWGIAKGEIREINVKRVAELYIDSLNGITSLCIMHAGKDIFPTKKDFKAIVEKQKELSEIFINGITARS